MSPCTEGRHFIFRKSQRTRRLTRNQRECWAGPLSSSHPLTLQRGGRTDPRPPSNELRSGSLDCRPVRFTRLLVGSFFQEAEDRGRGFPILESPKSFGVTDRRCASSGGPSSGQGPLPWLFSLRLPGPVRISAGVQALTPSFSFRSPVLKD